MCVQLNKYKRVNVARCFLHCTPKTLSCIVAELVTELFDLTSSWKSRTMKFCLCLNYIDTNFINFLSTYLFTANYCYLQTIY